MAFTPADKQYLQQALQLAVEAAAFASPNPTVGCVLVRDGKVLGAGAHFYDARDHAEIAALKQAAARGHSVRGATAYVTLEPCSHFGRTGPCADALVAGGIARCVVTTADPNPAVSGTGLAKLAAAGVEVTVLPPEAPLAEAARRLNDAFAFSVVYGRPFVTLKAALSVDGMLAPAAPARSAVAPVWLTGPEARQDVQRLRHSADALVTGVGTVLADDPALTDRTGLPRRRPLLRIVADTQLRTPLTAALLQGEASNVLFACAAAADSARRQALEQTGAAVLELPAGVHAGGNLRAVPPALLLDALQQRQCRGVLLEAGAGLNGAFLAASLVDRVVLYIAERELGAGAVPFSADGTNPYELIGRLRGVTRAAFASDSREDIRVAGYLHDPWDIR